MTVRQNSKGVVTLLILMVLIRPHVTFLPDVVSVYLFDVVGISLLLLTSNRLRIERNAVIGILCLTVTTFLKTIIVGFETDVFLAGGKIAYYAVFYRLFCQLCDRKKYEVYVFDKVLKFCFYYNIVICIIQLIEPPALGSIVHSIYGIDKLRSLWSGYPRVYGTFYNANWFGVYLVFMISYYTMQYCNQRKPLKYILQVMIVMLLVFVSGSRTAVIGSVIAVFSVLLINKRVKPVVGSIIVLGVLVSIGIILAPQFPLFSRTFVRFTSYFSILFSEDRSLASITGSRWSEWQASWQLFKDSPFFGNVIGNVIPHNSYIALLIRFGIVGLIAMIPLIVSFFRVLRFRGKNFRSWSVGFTIALLVVFFAGEYLFSTQVMLLEILLLCYVTLESDM